MHISNRKDEVIHGFSPSVAPLFRETLEPNYEIQEGKRPPPSSCAPAGFGSRGRT